MAITSQLGDLSPAGAIAIGIVVGLLSTCVQSIGLTLQRKSHLLEEEKENEDIRRPPYRRRRWQIGMLMFILANLVGSTIQITTLPLPVLSTLQASGLVFNTICASVLLKEPFTIWSFVGTALVAGGALLIAMFGALAEPSHTLQQLLDLLGRKQFILWMIGTFLIIGLILLSVLILNRLHPHSPSRGLRIYKGFAYGGISSILSAHSLLVAKSAVELLVRTIVDHKNQFNRWQSWVILLILVFFALSQLYFLHRGLKLVSTSILYPFVFCIYNIIAILDGLIYFHQISRLSALHAGLIALGTVILLSGVLCLSWRNSEESDSPPPPDAHTLLTPGMGLVEDTTTEDERGSDIDDDNVSVTSADEEAFASTPTERSPLLGSKARFLTPKEREDAILHVTKNRRHRTTRQNEDEEIQDELDDTAHDGDWRFPITSDDNFPRHDSLLDSGNHMEGAQHDSMGGRSARHKRVRSEDLFLPVQKSHVGSGSNKATSLRQPSASPTAAPKMGMMPRAKTVHHGSSVVSFAPSQRNPHPMTWRERDRERRRRTWSRTGGGPLINVPGAAAFSRGRSVSAPQDRRRSSARRQSRALHDTEAQAANGDEDIASDSQPVRESSGGKGLIGWFGNLFGKRPPGDDSK